MEMTREGDLTIVTLSHRNLDKLRESPPSSDLPGAIRKTDVGTLMIYVEDDEIHYAKRAQRREGEFVASQEGGC